jgi:hypothetical protein
MPPDPHTAPPQTPPPRRFAPRLGPLALGRLAPRLQILRTPLTIALCVIVPASGGWRNAD